MATSTRISAFLWHRVGQGYSRVVKDKPPFESWRAWRAGHRDHRPAPNLTSASSSSDRELASELDGVSAAAVADADAGLATHGPSSNCGADGYDTRVRTETAPPTLAGAAAAAAAATAASTSSSSSTETSYSEGAAVTGKLDWDEEEGELEYSPPSWSSEQSQLSSSSDSSGGTGQSTSTSTSDQERLFRQRQISFKLNAPDDMELAVIHCTLTKRKLMEGVKKVGKHVPPRNVTYGCFTPTSSLRNATES